VKTPTKWLKQTAHLLTSVGKKHEGGKLLSATLAWFYLGVGFALAGFTALVFNLLQA